MRAFSSAAALIAATLLPVAAAQANLLTNGSFEQPTGIPYASLPGGSHTLTGWTTVDNGVEWFNTAAYGSGPAPDGVMAIDLANYVYTGGGIEQSFATVAGQTYHLAFSLGTEQDFGRDGTAHIDVTVAGTTHGFDVTGHTDQITWTPFALDFQATGSSTTLRFANNENPFLHFANVDAVSVQAVTSAVPEPTSLALMLAGLGGLGALGRRRRLS